MPKTTKYMTFFLISIIWGLCFFYLTYTSLQPLQWLALFTIGFLTILFFVIFLTVLKQQNSYEERLRRLHIYSAAFAEFADVCVFDEHGRTVYTTHPHLYPHQKEFLRKILLKVAPSPEAATFKKWVEEHHSGEVVLSSGGDGLGQQQRRWLSRIRLIDPMQMGGQNYILVILMDLTSYLDNLKQIREQYDQLENFLDFAPFGIFYINKSGHFTGINETFAKWCNVDRDKVIGEKAISFLEDFSSDNDSPSIIYLKPHQKQKIKVIYFPPQKADSKIKAGMICKIDDVLLPSSTSDSTILKEVSFLYNKIPSLVLEKTGKILSVNPAFKKMMDDFSLQHDLSSGYIYDLLDPASVKDTKEKLKKVLDEKDRLTLIEMIFGSKKQPMMTHLSVLDNTLSSSKDLKLLVQCIDISEQKRLEQQFSQSQKMQAIGQLAGGIAHDFNNLLTAMIGFCDLLLQRYLPNDPSYMDIMQIKQNANRAANLVRQLLAFSRQQSLQPKVIDITDVLSELSALLRRLIGVNIELNLIHGRDLKPIKADVSQLEQVMVNMVVNARDSMSKGGTLTIRTSNYICLKAKTLGHEVMPKGEYVMIEIEDTGTGIPLEVIDRIFEPFFSTKEVGAGTGLGLSTVYGIIKQSNAYISVESVVHKGTIFKIYFPQSEEEIQKTVILEDLSTNTFSKGGTILLVEDEEAVRMFSARALREKGYTVLEAENGEDALKIIKKGEKFDLLVTDVVMPKMDGPTLNKKVRDIIPQMKTIFISGYAEDTFRKNLGTNAQIHFLPKPFSLKDLIFKVQEVLK
ncbi:MAG: response regulator [Proteobacteria bacterium]|nr:response regulator [Pseudomonadota bacterium]